MSNTTFAAPDLTTFCRLDELGLEAVGQRLEPDRAVIACRVIACRVVATDDWCRRCGCQGVARDTTIRRLAHEPLGWRPTMLEVTLRRSQCTGCGHVWRQDTTLAAEPRAKLSRRGLRWELEGIVVQHLTVARVTEGLGVAQNTANDASPAAPQPRQLPPQNAPHHRWTPHQTVKSRYTPIPSTTDRNKTQGSSRALGNSPSPPRDYQPTGQKEKFEPSH